MAHTVNLDALIPREDFDVIPDASQSQFVQTAQIRDLEQGSFFYHVLRKPDFQRETADWTAGKIVDFVESFLGGDLIPAIILWNSGSNNFVIDGAHRLSALISWVHDDYGDGAASLAFFESRIPDEQRAVADETRRLIARRLGSYRDHQLAIQHPTKAKPDVVERAKRLAALALQLQWVKGNAEKAEDSFFKINQQAAPIDQTELRLLRARKNPNALAARAIVRSGTGHKYWSKFGIEQQQEIEDAAKEINAALFVPNLRTPIKTLDLPVAGRGYSAETLPLIVELVELSNNMRVVSDGRRKATKGKTETLAPDVDGSQTIRFLKNTRRIVNRISGTHPSSLGLHPAVYFYSTAGRYQPTSFLAIVGLMQDWEKKNYFETFTRHRRSFEEFILKYKSFVNQVVYKWGSKSKGFAQVQALYDYVVHALAAGSSESEILIALKQDSTFSFLDATEPVSLAQGKDFSTETKSAAFLREALTNPMRCKICEGLIHMNAMTVDHVTRKQDGGRGVLENAQLAHPYCNTTFKN